MLDPLIGYNIVTDPETGEVIAVPVENQDKMTEMSVEPPWSLVAKLHDPRDDPEFNRAKVAGLAGR